MTSTPLNLNDYIPLQFFYDDLNRRIRNQNKNNVILCIGEPGNGKSWGALRIAEVLKPSFTTDYVIFTAQSMLDILANDEVKKGDVIIFDEVSGSEKGAHSRRAMTHTNMVLSWTGQTHRSLNYTLIMTCPNYSMLDKDLRSLVNFVIDFKKVDFERNRSLALIKYSSTDRYRGYNYLKLPRLQKVGTKRKKVRRAWFSRPSFDLIKPYEKKKKKFQLENYAAYAKKLRGEKKINEKINMTELFKNAWIRRGYFVNEKGKVEPSLLRCEYNLGINSTKLLSKALQIKHDKLL